MSEHIYRKGIFLTYVNIPLEKYPQGFSKVLEKMVKIKYWKKLEPELKDAVADVLKKDKAGYSDKIKGKLLREHLGESYREILRIRPLAVYLPDEVYGAQLSRCKEDPETFPFKCYWGSDRRKIFETKGLKCYECDYLHFRHILTRISEGRKYSEIAGLEKLVHYFSREESYFTIQQSPEAPFREIIARSSGKSQYGMPMSFPRCLKGAVTQSLVSFLIYEDGRKLKRCEHCGKFYVQGKLDPRQKYCSEKCGSAERRYPPEKLKTYMRQRRKAQKRKQNPAKRKRSRKCTSIGS